MARSDLDKLTQYIAPYYQDAGDVAFLNEYLTEYTYPDCAAAQLWYELAGKVGLQSQGVSKLDAGSEKVHYNSPDTLQKTCSKQGDYYQSKCNDITGSGSCAIIVDKATVGGVTETFGVPDDS